MYTGFERTLRQSLKKPQNLLMSTKLLVPVGVGPNDGGDAAAQYR
jgi:hypothetical protein